MLSQKADKNDISLVEHITWYLESQKDNEDKEFQGFKPGICNRLDRNTSGLIVAGKSIKGLQSMNELFRERKLKKYYLCIVKGKITKFKRIDGYHQQKMKITIRLLSQIKCQRGHTAL